MAARSRGGVLIAGLVLIVIGTLFLLDNWYPDFSAWRLVARYWPVILILVGLRKIYGYFTWEQVPPLPGEHTKE